MKTYTSRDGFALPVAILALVVVGVLVTGGFFVARQESRISVASQHATKALYVAERGGFEVLSNWDNQAFNAMPVWSSQQFSGTTEEGEWTVDVLRMSSTTYFLDARGSVTEGGAELSGASRRMGMTARVIPAEIEPPSALTTRGNVDMVGNSAVEGHDQDPDQWGAEQCGTNVQEDKPGILTDENGSVSTDGQATYDGEPPHETDENITDETFTEFGDLSWAELTAMADKKFTGGGTHVVNGTGPAFNADGSCDTSVQTNWGDPENPSSSCGSYFPMIHFEGSARIQSGGVGQGIMLVDGNLDLRGDFVFYGIIIVQGTFETQGSGNRIVGGVMASNAQLEDQRLSGGSVVQQSTCSSRQAILQNQNLARPQVLATRGWVDLTSLSYN